MDVDWKNNNMVFLGHVKTSRYCLHLSLLNGIYISGNWKDVRGLDWFCWEGREGEEEEEEEDDDAAGRGAGSGVGAGVGGWAVAVAEAGADTEAVAEADTEAGGAGGGSPVAEK